MLPYLKLASSNCPSDLFLKAKDSKDIGKNQDLPHFLCSASCSWWRPSCRHPLVAATTPGKQRRLDTWGSPGQHWSRYFTDLILITLGGEGYHHPVPQMRKLRQNLENQLEDTA